SDIHSFLVLFNWWWRWPPCTVGVLRETGGLGLNRIAQNGKAGELGQTSVHDGDLHLKRSEVAHIVTAAQQPQSLIPAAAQGRRRRPVLVISTHHREIQTLSDPSPQSNLFRSSFPRDTEVP